MNTIENIITAKEYSLQDILSNKKYTVDFFQRDYNWTEENIKQLVFDLTEAFYTNYRPGDDENSIDRYNTYYMGPIVLCEKDGIDSIVDGQQRITSLTLLLIYLKHKTESFMQDFANEMIYSTKRGIKSFNIQIPERETCLSELFEHGTFSAKEDDDFSVKNMAARYIDIGNAFPEEITDEALKLFVYWLYEKVILVKITATSDKNAYMIFETMNDRGLSLSSTDMLKGFILSKYNDSKLRKTREDKWKKNMQDLFVYGKGTDYQFFQAWLRSQFAVTIRQSKAGSVNQDFEIIGERFHYWFRENYEKGLLQNAINGSIETFMDTNYSFYLKYYLLIKESELNFNKKLEHVYYIHCWGIAESLKFPLLLASLSITDSDETCFQKIDLVAKFIDCFCVRRSVNFRLFSAASIRYTMNNLVKEIRNKPVDDLKTILQNELDKEIANNKVTFETISNFRLHQKNYWFVKYYLARITSFIEIQTGSPSDFSNYIYNQNCKPFEIEHIWCDHIEQHSDEFTQITEFEDWRNKIGDLLLLQNGSNQSYGDLPYSEKVPHYLKENILARSLCSDTYEHNPNFVNFVQKEKLSFKSHPEFQKKDILDRCELYKQISEKIWGEI